MVLRNVGPSGGPHLLTSRQVSDGPDEGCGSGIDVSDRNSNASAICKVLGYHLRGGRGNDYATGSHRLKDSNRIDTTRPGVKEDIRSS
jgi:hypothetical protein